MRNIITLIILILSYCPFSTCLAEEDVFRIGLIGLDTSHVISYTKYLNDPENKTGCKVVAGYPGGSPDVTASATRVEGFTTKLRDECGLEIVDSIEQLCEKVDGIMLESVDGRPHLEQIKPVLAAKKPVFIDKPVAGSVADAIEIFRLAKEAGIPCWSSSSLRFSPDYQAAKTKYGNVTGCSTFGPCTIEEHHPDLYWYGIHGVELLYTIMGPGCKTVQRTHTDDYDYVVGVWNDGRIGTYRGLRSGKKEFGAVVFGDKGIGFAGKHERDHLIEHIVKFFKTGTVPVSPEETIEIFAFMTATDESKRQNGKPVLLESVLPKGD